MGENARADLIRLHFKTFPGRKKKKSGLAGDVISIRYLIGRESARALLTQSLSHACSVQVRSWGEEEACRVWWSVAQYYLLISDVS